MFWEWAKRLSFYLIVAWGIFAILLVLVTPQISRYEGEGSPRKNSPTTGGKTDG